MGGVANIKKSRREEILEEMEGIFMSATDKMEITEIHALNQKASNIIAAGHPAERSAPKPKSRRKAHSKGLLLVRAAQK